MTQTHKPVADILNLSHKIFQDWLHPGLFVAELQVPSDKLDEAAFTIEVILPGVGYGRGGLGFTKMFV